MRIDIHTHFIPPQFIEAARRGRALNSVVLEKRDDAEWMIHPQGYRYPLAREFWDVEAKLSQMDRLGFDVSVLSISPPLFFYWTEVAAAVEFCQMANEAAAQMAAESGDRLRAMATVPLQDPEAAVRELQRAVRELGLTGVEIGTTMETLPLDDPRFEPFFAAAAELETPVMLHPYYVGPRAGLADYYMTNLIGNPLETTIAAARLTLSGMLERHPGLDLVLVHAGGFLPFQFGRLDHGWRVRKETSAVIRVPPSTFLRRMYVDTITHADQPLKYLVELMGSDRVMIGTDIPFDMQDLVFKERLASTGLKESDMKRVEADNARRLFHLQLAEETIA